MNLPHFPISVTFSALNNLHPNSRYRYPKFDTLFDKKRRKTNLKVVQVQKAQVVSHPRNSTFTKRNSRNKTNKNRIVSDQTTEAIVYNMNNIILITIC